MKLIKNSILRFFTFLILAALSFNTVKALQSTAENYFVYVTLKDDNAIAIYKMNPLTGALHFLKKQDINGGPASITLDPSKKYLYVAQRTSNSISSYKVDHKTGLLKLLNTIPAVDNPVYISTDKTGRYLLSAYYNASKIGIYTIHKNGELEKTLIQVDSTEKNPHSILVDKTNRFLYVADKSADKIYQFIFDASTGKIKPNNPKILNTPPGTGPRHFVFNNKNKIIYFVNELNGTVTAYHLNSLSGIITPFQTISTLPKNFNGTNTSADIHLTPNNKFLYTTNRGPNSIAGFSVNSKSGRLEFIGTFSTVKTPRAFNIAPGGKFLITAGEDSDNIASYRIDQRTGKLKPLEIIHVGARPSWVLIEKF